MFRFVRYFAAHCESGLPNPSNDHSFIPETERIKKFPTKLQNNGDPLSCLSPACTDKMSFFKQALANEKKGNLTKVEDHPINISIHDPSEGIDFHSKVEKTTDCPLDRAELGASTWNLLHTIAAYYPDDPSPEKKKITLQFLEALALLYPCEYCAAEFQDSIKQSPPRLDSREEFSIWLCQQHNEVNERLGKPVFDCALINIDKRWKYGSPGCWNYTLKDKLHDNLKDKLHDDHSP